MLRHDDAGEFTGMGRAELYCYLHYHSRINKNGTLCSFQCEDFGTYEDFSLFGGKKLYPSTLAKIMAAYQKPFAEAQKQFIAFIAVQWHAELLVINEINSEQTTDHVIAI